MTRAFRYTGNISHIKAYIDKNKLGDDCIVEMYVRPLNAEERACYRVPGAAKRLQARNHSHGSRLLPSAGKMEKRSGQISGADLKKWADKLPAAKKRQKQ